MKSTFIWYAFSGKRLFMSAILNFIAGAFYYQLFRDGFSLSAFVSIGWAVFTTILITAIITGYYLLLWSEFKNADNKTIGK